MDMANTDNLCGSFALAINSGRNGPSVSNDKRSPKVTQESKNLDEQQEYPSLIKLDFGVNMFTQ